MHSSFHMPTYHFPRFHTVSHTHMGSWHSPQFVCRHTLTNARQPAHNPVFHLWTPHLDHLLYLCHGGHGHAAR